MGMSLAFSLCTTCLLTFCVKNPSITAGCGNFKLNQSYCVDASKEPKTTTVTTSSSTTAPVHTSTPTTTSTTTTATTTKPDNGKHQCLTCEWSRMSSLIPLQASPPPRLRSQEWSTTATASTLSKRATPATALPLPTGYRYRISKNGTRMLVRSAQVFGPMSTPVLASSGSSDHQRSPLIGT